MSNAAFKRNFSKLLERAGDKAELVVRKVAQDFVASFVLKSPVDTGRFRANWNTGIGSMSLSTSISTDSGAELRASSILPSYKAGDTIYITNNLPYALRLEYGWSDQAPAGMVRTTIAEYSQFLRRAVAQVRT